MTSPSHNITLSRQIPAAPEAVFAAFTDPAQITRWYAPVDAWIVGRADITPGVGGGYVITFGPPPGGDAWTESGAYTAYDAGARLAWRGTVAGDGIENTSVIDITFTAEGSGTLVTVTESELTAEAANEHAEGWRTGLAQLEVAVLTA